MNRFSYVWWYAMYLWRMAIRLQHVGWFSFVLFCFYFSRLFNKNLFLFFSSARAECSHQSQLLCMVACFTVIQHLSKHWKEFARSLSKLSLDLRSTVWFDSVSFENAYIPPVPCAGVYNRVHAEANVFVWFAIIAS